jgi:hypothetical protein
MVLNPNYAVTIVQDSSKTYVTAPLPETFAYDTQADYQAPFSQGVFGSGAMGSLLRVAGVRLTSQILTAQIWQGSTDTTLSLELDFHADSDAEKDVQQPILKLLKLATASVKNNLLVAPGPSLNPEAASAILADTVDQVKRTGQFAANLATGNLTPAQLTPATSQLNGANQSQANQAGFATKENFSKYISNQISIQIGRYAFFDSIVVTNVQKTYTSAIDEATGFPTHAKVRIDFKPLFLVVQSDLDDIFKMRRTGSEDLRTRFSNQLGLGG